MEFKKYKLRDLGTVDISGIDKKSYEGEKPVRLCNFTDVYKNWAITKYHYPTLMKATAKDRDIEKFKIRKGQVAITKDSETRDDIGIPTYIADDFDDVVLGYHCALITPGDALDGQYLNAYLNSKMAKKYFEGYASGSGQRYTLTLDSINDFQIWLPEIKTQKRISKILSDIDRKIALNTRMNAELEAMAKQLYDYWFVQFDFPDENGNPYKSSGGKMVYNPTLKREIPAGWEVSTYGNEFDVKLGGTPSTSEDSFWVNGTINWLNSGEVQNFPINSSEKKITESALNNSSTEFLPKGSVLISITRYLRVTILNIDACINQSVAGFAESELLKHPYTYFALTAEVPRLMKLRTGAQQPHINKETIEASPILIPPASALSRYYAICNPILYELIKKSEETDNLTHLRDSLLPMLMNGQVTVE